MRKIVCRAAVLGAAFCGVAAHAATPVVTGTPLQVEADAGPGTLIDFEKAVPAQFATSGKLFQIGKTNDGNGAEPAGDTSNYLSVLGGGNYQLLGDTAYTNVSLYWGSIDGYNHLDLLDRDGKSIATIEGSMIPSISNGDQSSGATNQRVNIASDAAFYGLKFSSGGNSFEVDNVKFSGAVPEPASWALMLVGFGGMGATLRRRRDAARLGLA